MPVVHSAATARLLPSLASVFASRVSLSFVAAGCRARCSPHLSLSVSKQRACSFREFATTTTDESKSKSKSKSVTSNGTKSKNNSRSTTGDSKGSKRSSKKIKHRKRAPRCVWRDDENQKLLEGLGIFGKNWQRLSEHIGTTKTPAQVHTRLKSVRHLIRAHRPDGLPAKALRLLFGDENVGSIIAADDHHEPSKNPSISKLIRIINRIDWNADIWDQSHAKPAVKATKPAKSPSPSSSPSSSSSLASKVKWSQEEIERLREARERYGTHWDQIASFVGTRTPASCRGQSSRMENGKNFRLRWTAKQDDLLITLASRHGKDWNRISLLLGRTSRSTQAHFYKLQQKRNLPEIAGRLYRRKPLMAPYFVKRWSEAEIMRLMDGYERIGANWSALADYLGTGRSISAVKMCFYNNRRSSRTKTDRQWTPEQDERLMQAVAQAKGPKNSRIAWQAVAKQVGDGKTAFDCNYRWRFSLATTKIKWTADMDAKLLSCTHRNAAINWSAVALEVDGVRRMQQQHDYHEQRQRQTAFISTAAGESSGQETTSGGGIVHVDFDASGRWDITNSSDTANESNSQSRLTQSEQDQEGDDIVKNKDNQGPAAGSSSLAVTAEECIARLKYLRRHNAHWTAEEDEILRSCVKEQLQQYNVRKSAGAGDDSNGSDTSKNDGKRIIKESKIDWNLVIKRMNSNKSKNQCQLRWVRKYRRFEVAQQGSRLPWSHEEDAILLEIVTKLRPLGAFPLTVQLLDPPKKADVVDQQRTQQPSKGGEGNEGEEAHHHHDHQQQQQQQQQHQQQQQQQMMDTAAKMTENQTDKSTQLLREKDLEEEEEALEEQDMESMRTTPRWKQTAEMLVARTGILRTEIQCFLRWKNHVDPRISKEPFSEEEDSLLVKLAGQLGHRFVQISYLMNGRRSPYQLRRRYLTMQAGSW